MNDHSAGDQPPTRGAEPPIRADAERAFLGLIREHDLPEPDEVHDHHDGGILCLWHEPKVAVIIDLE